MNAPDLFYIITMPIGWFSSILDTSRIIKLKSAKGRAISSYSIGLFLVFSSVLRAGFSIHDFLFTFNGIVILLLNTFQLICIIKWRNA